MKSREDSHREIVRRSNTLTRTALSDEGPEGPGSLLRAARAFASVSPGEDSGLARLAGDEVLPFFALEGQEPYRSLRLFLYLLLGPFGTVPGRHYKPALLL